MSTNSKISWRCQNYGSCAHADDSTPIPLEPGSPFRCPDCGWEEVVRQSKTKFPVFPVVGGLGGLILLFGLIKLLQPPEPPTKKPGSLPLPVASSASAGVVEKDLRTAIDRQILARPDSRVYADTKDATPTEKLPGNFERFFVFGSEPGWLEIGETRNAPIGWMKEEDTVDWPHAIVVEHGSPENRLPVLYFKNEKDLADLLNSGDLREERVRKLYEEADEAVRSGKPLSPGHPVICIEPSQNDDGLSITPVLEAKMGTTGRQPTRLLRITAAGSERGSTTLDNPEYVSLLKRNRDLSAEVESGTDGGIDFDIVFVVDTTGSMQPWVDGLFSVISGVASGIRDDPKIAGRVHFGFWGYQDNPGYSGIQYLTRNYTSELVDAAEFSALLSQIKVNQRTSDSYPEDVFAGVTDAIGKTAWRSANRVAVVIGDAPGHTKVASGGAGDIDAPQVRQIATDAGVSIVALAIKDGSSANYRKHHPLLEDQFRLLATNGNRAPALVSVTDAGMEEFKTTMKQIVSELAEQRSLDRSDGGTEETDDSEQTGDPSGFEIASGLLESANVRVIAEIVNAEGETVAPRDISGWVADRDLLKPEIASLEPKLLVTKDELNKLLILAEGLIRNAEDAKIVGGDFHDAVLRAVAGTASNSRTDSLKDSLPDFIKGLPYRSEFMEKSKDWWAAPSQEEQERFIDTMKAKLTYYRTVNENPSLWKPLNRDSGGGDYVAAIPLKQLL